MNLGIDQPGLRGALWFQIRIYVLSQLFAGGRADERRLLVGNLRLSSPYTHCLAPEIPVSILSITL